MSIPACFTQDKRTNTAAFISEKNSKKRKRKRAIGGVNPSCDASDGAHDIFPLSGPTLFLATAVIVEALLGIFTQDAVASAYVDEKR